MKSIKNVKMLTSLKVDSNGIFSGGFASLDVSQMNKIKGGKKAPDSNDYCTNGSCSSGNGQCTNTSSCT